MLSTPCMLSMVYAHPRGPATTGPYVCGRCTRLKASAAVATPCGATLIVCPTPILEQWRQEIQKHIRDGVATSAPLLCALTVG